MFLSRFKMVIIIKYVKKTIILKLLLKLKKNEIEKY